MTTTSPVVAFGSNALAIRDDVTYSLYVGSLLSGSSLDDLKNDTVATKPYITFEPDYWKLDGNYHFMPSTNAQAGLIGSTLSNSPNGNFDTVIDVQIDFSVVHSTVGGLSFVFSQYTGDWLDYIVIKYYDNSYALIREDIYTPSGVTFSTNQAVSNFRRIHITLNSTNKTYRFPRISRIDFDTLTRFTDAEIQEARLVEEINPLSVELPYNTLDLTLYSADGDFSITDPQGIYANLQENEPLDVYENINGAIVYMGRFYLYDWQSKSKNTATFKAFDALGLLDKNPFLSTHEGIYYQMHAEGGLGGSRILVDIFVDMPFTYSLDSSYVNSGIITGWIPPCTRREALQQLCFRLGAIATCARSNVVNIIPMELASDLTEYDFTLTDAEKGLQSPVELKPLVTGAEVWSHAFNYIETDKIFFSGTLSVGEHIFPVNDVVLETGLVSGTVDVDWDSYWTYSNNFIVTVLIEKAFTLTLDTYFEFTKKRHLVSVAPPTGKSPNIIKIEDAPLIGSYNTVQAPGTTTAQRVYDYYQQRYIQKTRLTASEIAPGDSVLIDTQSSKQIKGVVEKMTTDLARGCVQDIEIVGVVA